jgi:ABC-type lipopolysaccharide export system ATPase subunit
MNHTLEADGIQLSFSGRKILTDVYMKCETGRITGILGRNGEGKSCLMQIIYGTLPLDIKSVRFDGEYVGKAHTRNDLLAYLPQFNFIPKRLTVSRVLTDFELDISDFLRVFPDFSGAPNTTVGQLSGGQRRLVELYVIIKSRARFIMLDEPFSHISPVQVDQIKELIMVEKQNKGFFLTDHMYRHILDISDDIYVLQQGKLSLTRSESDIENLGYVRFRPDN